MRRRGLPYVYDVRIFRKKGPKSGGAAHLAFPEGAQALLDPNEQAIRARSLYAIYNLFCMTPTEPSSGLGDLDAFLDDPRWDRIASFGTGAEPSAGPHNASSEDDHFPTNGRPFKLPAPPRRGRPPRRWDKEAALDLWLHVPPGYVRDVRGRWRYEATGTAVPGAATRPWRPYIPLPRRTTYSLFPST